MKVWIVEGVEPDYEGGYDQCIIAVFWEHSKAVDKVKELEKEYPLWQFSCSDFEINE